MIGVSASTIKMVKHHGDFPLKILIGFKPEHLFASLIGLENLTKLIYRLMDHSDIPKAPLSTEALVTAPKSP